MIGARRTRRRNALVVSIAAAAMLLSACSSSDDAERGMDDGEDGAGEQVESAESVGYTVPAPTISAPPAEGAGVTSPQPAVALPDGYTQEELFVGGTATSFAPIDTPDDGAWSVRPDETAEYRTRVIVKRPPPDRFSGTVIVEWYNVSAIEASPDWAYLSKEIGREGHAYIGVSAQSQGVVGGDTLLDVSVDEEAAEDAGASVDRSGLKHVDPERYGTLEHPGDQYAFDIFSQVGRAATEDPDTLLGGLVPEQVIAVGESQSAAFLSTVVNAVHPLDPVYDGFLVHSRGANTAALEGVYRRANDDSTTAEEAAQQIAESAVRIRTDLDEPVVVVETETDLTLLGYAHARQPDTDRLRTWEIAGTAHSDAHMLRALLGGPRDPMSGSLLGCTEPINTGPHHEVVQAALHHLVGWTAGGEPPPEAARIELRNGEGDGDGGGEEGEVVIARDDLGIAVGGVRTPLVDVPISASTGEPAGGAGLEELVTDGDICVLFGTTIPFDQPTLVQLHGSFDAYLQAFRDSAADAVAAGFLLQPDADDLIAEAEQNRPLFG